MASSAYWQRRFALLEEAQHRSAEAYLQDMDRAFRESSVQLEKEIARWYQRFADNNEVSLADAKRMLNARELSELKWDINEYIRRGQENALDGRWMKQLENASVRVHVSRLEAIQLQMQQQVEALFGGQRDGIDQLMRKVYSDGYYHTAFEYQKGFGVGWDLQPLNEKSIERVLSRPWMADGRTFFGSNLDAAEGADGQASDGADAGADTRGTAAKGHPGDFRAVWGCQAQSGTAGQHGDRILRIGSAAGLLQDAGCRKVSDTGDAG